MSDYNSTATSTIYVNGKPAEQELQKLKQRASDLRDAIASAAKAGEKADLKKLRNELKQANREIKQVEGSIHSCEVVMKRPWSVARGLGMNRLKRLRELRARYQSATTS